MNRPIDAAIVRLTLWYLGIIMVLSIGFSVYVYSMYVQELERGLRRPQVIINLKQLPIGISEYERLRAEQLAEGKRHIQQNLVFLNLGMLIVGGVVSYALARRTLTPVAEAMENQSRFAADASHELRTPLTAMQTEIEVALRRPGLTKHEAKSLLQSNLEEVAKLRALSDGLLKLAHSDGKELPAVELALDLVVIEAVNRVLQAAEKKQITITSELKSLKVRGDEQSLTELFVILLDNAIKYSKPHTTITLTCKQHSKAAHVAVSDQGRGIKPEDVPHIFERFYRSDSSRSKEASDGYGLGLSIAHKIVEAHGGAIEAKSTLGKGSTFTVKLPLS